MTTDFELHALLKARADRAAEEMRAFRTPGPDRPADWLDRSFELAKLRDFLLKACVALETAGDIDPASAPEGFQPQAFRPES